jgi:RES domain-containing protein
LELAGASQAFPSLSNAQLGDLWIDSLAAAVLRVRSAVVAAEDIYLLNPAHAQFHQITVEEIVAFTFDERLLAKVVS